MRPTYRGDVDGLRAIAVLLVVAFHAFPRKVPGGFIGVDIFFVISGFLITSLILRAKQDGEFTFTDFYARRIKRIFPALIVVLATCLVVGWFVLFPGEYRDLAKHTAAGAGFIANFSFLQEIGYFDVTADHKPLLHLWSLGIEEQFYIVWPLLIVLAWRWKNGPLIMAGAICLGSFVWSVILTKTSPGQAFFLPFTRFWELMVGCIIAFAATHDSFAAMTPARLVAFYERNRQAAHECAGWLGIALIALGAALIHPNRGFPGWWALLPTAGTALLIAAGPQATFNRLLLSHRAMIYIGLISYPLYLWHWPILSFARMIHFKEPTDLVKGLCIALAFALAYLTYRYIERPIRFGPPTPRKPIMASTALAAVGCLGLLIFAGSGIPSRFPRELQALVADFRNPEEDQHTYRCLANPDIKQMFDETCDGAGPPGAKRVLLWGDSHAAQLGPGLQELERTTGRFRFSQYSSGGCPPGLMFPTGKQTNCPAVEGLVLNKIKELRPDTVILAGRWELYDGKTGFGLVDADSIRTIVAQIKAMGVNRVVVLGQFPIWQASVPRLRVRNYRLRSAGVGGATAADIERDKTYLNARTFEGDSRIKDATSRAGAIYVSALATLCNDEGCLLVVPNSDGKPIGWDDNHLTRSGSIFFITQNAAALIGP